METIADIEFKITSINELFDDYITYSDSISFTDENQKQFVTSDTLLFNTRVSKETSIQSLEETKKNSLNEFTLTLTEDTTLYNVCFQAYGVVNDDLFDQLIIANDLTGLNRTDIDPNDPLLRKGMVFIYYK
jgi:hypothetical protein